MVHRLDLRFVHSLSGTNLLGLQQSRPHTLVRLIALENELFNAPCTGTPSNHGNTIMFREDQPQEGNGAPNG